MKKLLLILLLLSSSTVNAENVMDKTTITPVPADDYLYVIDDGTTDGKATISSVMTQSESTLEGLLDLSDLQGSVTDTQVPNTITIDAATALSANGANCSAGSAPLGVDASGAVESCFDVWTEAENTSAGYISTVSSDADWTDHNSYPSACSAGQYVSGIGDTLTCDTPADTNTTYTAGGTLLDLTGTVFSVNEGTLTDTKYCTYESASGIVCNSEGGAGYTDLTSFDDQTAWRVFYSNTDGDVTELGFGADGTFLKSNGATSAPTFAVPAGSGDVSKVDTPADNQVGVWTGDGTIEGDADLTFDGYDLTVSGAITATTGTMNIVGNVTGNVSGTSGSTTGNAATVTFADAAADTTTWVALGTGQTGSLAPATDAGLTYNANTNALTATTFVGALTGTASGNLVSSDINTYSELNTIVADQTLAYGGGAFHDGFSDFDADEHIDWTASSAGTIHSTNYVDNNTTYTAGDNITLNGTDFDVDDAFLINNGDDTTTGKLTVDGGLLTTASATFDGDNIGTIYGDSQDASIYWDGTENNLVINTGSRSLEVISDGNATIGMGDASIYFDGTDIWAYDGSSYYNLTD